MAMPGVAQGAPPRSIRCARSSCTGSPTAASAAHQVLVGNLVDRRRRATRGACAGSSCADSGGAWALVPGGHLRARRDATAGWAAIAMDGARQHRARLQRLERLGRFPACATGPPGERPAGHDAGGRDGARRRHGRPTQQPLRRLLGDVGRPGGRLHLLVHRRVQRRHRTWSTRIGSLQVRRLRHARLHPRRRRPASQASAPAPTPSTRSTVGSVAGFDQPVTLAATGNPAGTTTGFSPNPVTTPPGSSTLTVGNTGAVAPGPYYDRRQRHLRASGCVRP